MTTKGGGRPKGIPKTGGRQKGTPNKITTDVRQGILDAAEKLGGIPRLVAWSKEDPKNEAIFWSQIYIKVIPKEINANIDVGIDLAARLARARAAVDGGQ